MANEVTFFVVEDHTLTNRGIRELIGERSRFTCIGYAFSKSAAKIQNFLYSRKKIIYFSVFLGTLK